MSGTGIGGIRPTTPRILPQPQDDGEVVYDPEMNKERFIEKAQEWCEYLDKKKQAFEIFLQICKNANEYDIHESYEGFYSSWLFELAYEIGMDSWQAVYQASEAFSPRPTCVAETAEG